MAPHLAPVNPPLGPQPPNPHLYSPEQSTLVMKEKVFSLSGDDFTIRTVSGTDVCKCKGHIASLRDAKKFTDINGNELFTLKNKMLSIHKSFKGDAPGGGAHDFEVKGHFSLMGSKSSVHFKNASDGQDVELEVKGDWFDRSAEISWGGRPVAAISRSFFNVRELFGDKQSYQVTVAPNVDLSLIAAICVSLDEKENETDK